MQIKFGTDGWRGIIAEDFTFGNLRRVSAAVTEYLHQQDLARKGLVIGYDTRFLAEQFAETVAAHLTARGIPVYMAKAATPTPVIAHSILDKKAAGAVMLTASHNPPEYNGFKFIPEYAGPATPDITDAITALIPETAEPVKINRDLITEFDPAPAYKQFLAQQVDFAKLKKITNKIIVNPMHGAGVGYMEAILADLGLDIDVQRNWRDPLFGGIMPEPKPELLTDLREAVVAAQGLGLALDGDGDRFGIIDSAGKYLLPNQVLCLLANYLLTQRGIKGPLARTVSTTTMLDRIAKKHGVEIIETPVGFKFQAEAMRKQGAILAGEESGGLSIAGHIPEKDGILACLLMAEITVHYGKPLSELMDELYDEYGKLYTRRLDFRTDADKKQAILKQLEAFKPETIGEARVTDIVRIDGWKYLLDDGSWLLVRASGTEAVFRIYCETDSEAKLDTLQHALAKELELE
ncbi:MAG: phosphoglucomutase/phosphomannomutase family protein [Firmicutes bacterium]|nr:phosphoglucomutase/phosphomannomutase family protein [Bacillota bacterium]